MISNHGNVVDVGLDAMSKPDMTSGFENLAVWFEAAIFVFAETMISITNK